jgi:hypothetical protein
MPGPVSTNPYSEIGFFFTYVDVDGMFIGLCLEWFLYGKISVLCVPLSDYYSPVY